MGPVTIETVGQGAAVTAFFTSVEPRVAEFPDGVLTTLLGGEYDLRNLFPVGTFTEDPATGSAAATFGGYLRLLSLVEPPSRGVVHQGSHVGRASVLTVDIPPSGGIIVSGEAVEIS